ncbi:leucine-rich repeat domain-containing protein [Anaerolineales bacterium HSG25]|nr:leucine-rich repeat domain-containing protein [Anaerolineales bacterium HSG25]
MNNHPITLTKELGRGGEATVYNIANQADMVAKLYHQPTSEREAKLRAMLMNPPEQPSGGHVAIAWPTALLYKRDSQLYATVPESAPQSPQRGKSISPQSSLHGKPVPSPFGRGLGGGGRFVGFLMPKISGGRAIYNMYNPRMREQLPYPFDWRALHRTAYNLGAVVSAIHAKGYVIGDINESNILVNREALVTIVDCDSFQVTDEQGTIHRCQVGKPEYTPPELQGIQFKTVDQSTEHDLFGLGILLFQLLMEGFHPFTGVLKSQESVGRVDLYAIRQGLFPYSDTPSISPPPSAPEFGWLAPDLQHLFKTCFVRGHTQPVLRPTAPTWRTTLKQAEQRLRLCKKGHLYSPHVTQCPKCRQLTRKSSKPKRAKKTKPTTPSHKKHAPKSAPIPQSTPSSQPQVLTDLEKMLVTFTSEEVIIPVAIIGLLVFLPSIFYTNTISLGYYLTFGGYFLWSLVGVMYVTGWFTNRYLSLPTHVGNIPIASMWIIRVETTLLALGATSYLRSASQADDTSLIIYLLMAIVAWGLAFFTYESGLNIWLKQTKQPADWLRSVGQFAAVGVIVVALYLPSGVGKTWVNLGSHGMVLADVSTLALTEEYPLPPEIGQLKNLQLLELDYLRLKYLPPEIGQLQNLQTLNVNGNSGLILPSEIGQLKNLQTLAAGNSHGLTLPPEIGQLQNLRYLYLHKAFLKSVPPVVSQLENLQELNLEGNDLVSLSPEIGQLKNLQSLDLYDNKLINLPPEIGQLQSLQTLDLQDNDLTELPPEIGQLQSLQTLNLRDNDLTELPPEIGQLHSLQTLDISRNDLIPLPPEINQLQNLQVLKLNYCNLSKYTPEINQLKNLQLLDLEGNDRIELSPEISQLKNLQLLDLNGNDMKVLPPEIGQLKSLEVLDLSHMRHLTTLPLEISQLKNLQKLNLWRTDLTIPPEIEQMPGLQIDGRW